MLREYLIKKEVLVGGCCIRASEYDHASEAKLRCAQKIVSTIFLGSAGRFLQKGGLAN